MNNIKFERVSGEGVDALYNLFIEDMLVATSISMDEVMERISNAYEDETHV